MRRGRAVPVIAAVVLVAAGVAVGIVAAAHATRPGQRFVVPASINATGATDVTREMNEFLASLPPDAVVNFPSGAVYRAEGTLVVSGKHRITLDGDGATIEETTTGVDATPTPGRAFKWPRLRASLLVEYSTSVSIEGLDIDGPNDPGGPGSYDAALEAQAGVDVEGCKGVVIAGVHIEHVYGDFVYIAGASTDVQVTGNTFRDNGRQGVSVTNGSDILISDNEISEIGRSAFDLEPNTASCLAEDVTISYNTVTMEHLSFVAAGGQGPYVDHVSILDNTLIDFPMDIYERASDKARRSNWIVKGNTDHYVVGSPLAPIRFYYMDNLTISDNVMPMAADRPSVAVYLVDPCGWTLSGNTFPGAEKTEPQGIAGSCPW